MVEIKDKKLAKQIEENPIAKEQFESALKKACQPIEKSQSFPKSSET